MLICEYTLPRSSAPGRHVACGPHHAIKRRAGGGIAQLDQQEGGVRRQRGGDGHAVVSGDEWVGLRCLCPCSAASLTA